LRSEPVNGVQRAFVGVPVRTALRCTDIYLRCTEAKLIFEVRSAYLSKIRESNCSQPWSMRWGGFALDVIYNVHVRFQSGYRLALAGKA
jgi:hypothetical protein